MNKDTHKPCFILTFLTIELKQYNKYKQKQTYESYHFKYLFFCNPTEMSCKFGFGERNIQHIFKDTSERIFSATTCTYPKENLQIYQLKSMKSFFDF